jgi:hypothetical protein
MGSDTTHRLANERERAGLENPIVQMSPIVEIKGRIPPPSSHEWFGELLVTAETRFERHLCLR